MARQNRNDDDEEVRFIQVFRAAALQAGAVARRLQGEVRALTKRVEVLQEAAALSAADLAAQDVLLLRLSEEFSHAAMDAEEDTASARLFSRRSSRLIVVDPIDGTFNGLHGSRDDAVMGALLRDGVYRASVIHDPEGETTYWARIDHGCHREDGVGGPRRVRVAHTGGSMVLPRLATSVRRRFGALGLPVVTSRCSAVDTAAPALGRAVASFSQYPPDHRRAIGFLLTMESGGTVLFEDGPWHGEDPEGGVRAFGPPVVASSAALARRALQACLGRPRR